MKQLLKKPIPDYSHANWKAPDNIKTYIFTRHYGYSVDNFMSLNLATHVNDNKINVEKNRKLINSLLPSAPIWINQTHSNNVAIVKSSTQVIGNYDASITTLKNIPLVILTADCLPLLLTNTKGTLIGTIHAGWKGLENEIITNTINTIYQEYKIPSNEIIVYIGPSICNKHFIVGKEILDLFDKKNIYNIKQIFPQYKNKFLCDLKLIATTQLINLGIHKQHIYSSKECTYCLNNKYYSYRHTNDTGRFASIIYIT